MKNVVHAIIESLRQHKSLSGHGILSFHVGGKHIGTVRIKCHCLMYWYHVVSGLRLYPKQLNVSMLFPLPVHKVKTCSKSLKHLQSRGRRILTTIVCHAQIRLYCVTINICTQIYREVSNLSLCQSFITVIY